MAFTITHDETDPSGSVAASDIDLKIRSVKVEMRERLQSLSGLDSTALNVDPVVPTKYGSRITIDTNAIRTTIFDCGNSFSGGLHTSLAYTNGNRQKISINAATWVPTAIAAGAEGSDFILKVTYSTVGASITWPSNIKFTSGTPPTITTNGISLFSFYSLDGTNLLCTLVGTAIA